MKTIILININEDPRKLVSKLAELISCHKIEYCMKSERPDVYLRYLLVRLKRIEKSTGIFITNKDFNLEKNISEINQFKDQNDIKIITLK